MPELAHPLVLVRCSGEHFFFQPLIKQVFAVTNFVHRDGNIFINS
jgi:hypothetical protein